MQVSSFTLCWFKFCHKLKLTLHIWILFFIRTFLNIVPLLLIFIQIEQYGFQQCKGCIVVSKMIHDLFFCSTDTAPQQTTGALSAAYQPLPLHPDPLTPLQPPSQGDEERPSPTSVEGVVLSDHTGSCHHIFESLLLLTVQSITVVCMCSTILFISYATKRWPTSYIRLYMIQQY